MSEVNQLFGTAVRQRREVLGLSQEELAFQAGLHRTYISLIERGLRSASIETIAKLAKALRTTSSQLLEKIDEQSSEATTHELR